MNGTDSTAINLMGVIGLICACLQHTTAKFRASPLIRRSRGGAEALAEHENSFGEGGLIRTYLLKTQVPHLQFKQGIGVYYFFVSQRHGKGPAAQVANLPES